MLAKVSMKNPMTITAVMNGSDNKTTCLEKILKSDTEVIILPCNRFRTHWILVVIHIDPDPDPSTKFKIVIYDSLLGEHKDVVERIKQWLVDGYCKAEKSNNQIDGRKVQQQEIEVDYKVVEEQVNGSDCGVHVCMMIQCVLYAFLHEKLMGVEKCPIVYHIEMGTVTGSSSPGIELFRQYMAYLIVEAGRPAVNLTASDDSDNEDGVNNDTVEASKGAEAAFTDAEAASTGAAPGEEGGQAAFTDAEAAFTDAEAASTDPAAGAAAGGKGGQAAPTDPGKDLRELIASERLAQMHAAKTGISYLDSDQRKNDLIKLSDVVKNMFCLQESTIMSDSEEEAAGPPKRKRKD